MGLIGVDGPETAVPGCTRISSKQRAEKRNVAASRYKTFCVPMSVIITPLAAGPTNTPICAVVWIRALAAVNWLGRTRVGTTETRAGPKAVETMAIRNTIK